MTYHNIVIWHSEKFVPFSRSYKNGGLEPSSLIEVYAYGWRLIYCSVATFVVREPFVVSSVGSN